MFVVHSYPLAVVFCVLTMLCWGSWANSRKLAGKDWRLFWADRRAAALCFLVPVVLASAFGLIFARPAQDIEARVGHPGLRIV